MQKISENGTLAELLVLYQQMALQFAQMVSPQLGEQVANQILSQSGQPIPESMGTDAEIGEVKEEHPVVARARSDARASTQAD
jgi:hypothetical protein